MADCIGAQTVGQITAISNRAAAWLRANPPGQQVAIEPRGCPTPGACSCVEPIPPATEPGEQPVGQPYKLLEPGEVPSDELMEKWKGAAFAEYRSGGEPTWRTSALLAIAWARQQQAAELAALRGVPVAGISDEHRKAVCTAIAEALGGAYDCQRVWSAWSYGTMGSDDFTLTSEDDDRVAEIADAAIEAIGNFAISEGKVAMADAILALDAALAKAKADEETAAELARLQEAERVRKAQEAEAERKRQEDEAAELLKKEAPWLSKSSTGR